MSSAYIFISVRCWRLLGELSSALQLPSPTLYSVASPLTLTITSVLSARDVHRFSPIIIHKVASVDGTLGTTNNGDAWFAEQDTACNAVNRSQVGFQFVIVWAFYPSHLHLHGLDVVQHTFSSPTELLRSQGLVGVSYILSFDRFRHAYALRCCSSFKTNSYLGTRKSKSISLYRYSLVHLAYFYASGQFNFAYPSGRDHTDNTAVEHHINQNHLE